MLSEMLSVDPETESIVLDKTFVDDYNESVASIENVLNKLKESK
jgi:flagellar capping protein FliD